MATTCKKFEDSRGTLIFPIKDGKYSDSKECNLKECTLSINHKNVFRGLHINSFAKIITCINGSFIDIILDPKESNPEVKYFPIKQGEQVYCPAGYAHGFISLEDNSILSYYIEEAFENEIGGLLNYKDPILNILNNIPVKEHQLILNEKDLTAPYLQYDYFIIGAKGFIGSNIYNELSNSNKKVYVLNYRMNEIEKIENEIKLRNPKYFICAAGLTGNPNTKWCDTHKKETLMTNVIDQINILNICNKHNIHCTLIGSGCIFNDDKNEYTCNDLGNDYTNYYSESRILLEKLVKEFDNYLLLRINYPYSFKTEYINNTKNLLTKLINYEKIEDCNLSATNLDETISILLNMIEDNKIGIVNCVNKEQINTVSLIKLYYNENDLTFNKEIIQSNKYCPKLISDLF